MIRHLVGAIPCRFDSDLGTNSIKGLDPNTTADRKAELETNLRNYCRHDTWAMVEAATSSPALGNLRDPLICSAKISADNIALRQQLNARAQRRIQCVAILALTELIQHRM